MAKLFTKAIDDKLFSQYSKGSNLAAQKIVAKIFNPYGKGTWFLLNSDPDDPDYLYGIVVLDEVEVGSFLRSDLENLKFSGHNLPLERELYETFTETGEEMYQKLREEHGSQFDFSNDDDDNIEDFAEEIEEIEEEIVAPANEPSMLLTLQSLPYDLRKANSHNNKINGYGDPISSDKLKKIVYYATKAVEAGVPEKIVARFAIGTFITKNGEMEDTFASGIEIYTDEYIVKHFNTFIDLYQANEYESGFKYMNLGEEELHDLGFNFYEEYTHSYLNFKNEPSEAKYRIFITEDFTHILSRNVGETYAGLFSEDFIEGYEMAKLLINKSEYIKDADFFRNDLGGISAELAKTILTRAISEKVDTLNEELDYLNAELDDHEGDFEHGGETNYSLSELERQNAHAKELASRLSENNSRNSPNIIIDKKESHLENKYKNSDNALYLGEYGSDRKFANTNLQEDANTLLDWIYEQKWSDDDGSLETLKKSKIKSFEDKYGVKVKTSASYANGGDVPNKYSDKIEKIKLSPPREFIKSEFSGKINKNPFPYKQVLIPKKAVENLIDKKIDKNNFFINTEAVFKEVDKPDFKPDFSSASGSEYMYTKDGVYRRSNHWGWGIASCDWMLNTGDYGMCNKLPTHLQKECIELSEKKGYKIGYAKWTDFRHTSDGLPLYIHDILNGDPIDIGIFKFYYFPIIPTEYLTEELLEEMRKIRTFTQSELEAMNSEKKEFISNNSKDLEWKKEPFSTESLSLYASELSYFGKRENIKEGDEAFVRGSKAVINKIDGHTVELSWYGIEKYEFKSGGQTKSDDKKQYQTTDFSIKEPVMVNISKEGKGVDSFWVDGKIKEIHDNSVVVERSAGNSSETVSMTIPMNVLHTGYIVTIPDSEIYAKGGKLTPREIAEQAYVPRFKEGDIVANTRTRTIGIVRMPDDTFGEVKTDSDGNVSVDDLEYFNINKHKNYHIATSTRKESGFNFGLTDNSEEIIDKKKKPNSPPQEKPKNSRSTFMNICKARRLEGEGWYDCQQRIAKEMNKNKKN